jgi:hypothetical protein
MRALPCGRAQRWPSASWRVCRCADERAGAREAEGRAERAAAEVAAPEERERASLGAGWFAIAADGAAQRLQRILDWVPGEGKELQWAAREAAR